MAPSRKRKKKNPTPLESSAISSPTNPSNQNDSEPGDEDEGDQHSPHEHTTPTQAPLTDEEALQRARTNYANGISASYKMYLTPELSSQLDKLGRRMIAYPCKLCGQSINRPTSDSSCGNLNKHVAGCLRKQKESKKTHSLANLGIKGTGDIDAKEVSQLCAVWCAEAARPFSALVDKSHQALLHPTILKHLPSRRAVSRDIHMLYSAIPTKVQSGSHGALYLGVDAWQSPNGFDILGIRHLPIGGACVGKIKAGGNASGLCLPSQRHTGAYLADSVRLVVEKFGIQQKICGIVSDNASNNEVMVRELKKQKWPRFKGEGQWVRCFAHVLNLIVQGILRPFGTNKKNTTATTTQDVSSGSDSGTDYAAEQIRPFNRDQDTSSGEEESSSSEIETAGHLEDSDLLNLDDIENASDEDETDRYTIPGDC
ncbi:hypothetical protein PSTT_16275 [Puccinia striiformis]|uniref:DUF659 domain-containing protein n=1 Tax=Puccinia striiformis TaxID=27350 RepID=A0A2S4UDR4_9BASI|nr:hypothetical protein PSTT_16275 [Puccinia striiformis]